LSFRQRQDFGLGGAEKRLGFRQIGHAGVGERGAQLIGGRRFVGQQKLDTAGYSWRRSHWVSGGPPRADKPV
jgi:hypothetical protein